MTNHWQPFLRAFVASVLAALLTSSAQAKSWGPREDVGVAAVDTRTGKVLWEAWRLDEVPAGASNEEKTAVEYLLALTRDSEKPLPKVTPLPDFDVKGSEIKNPWPDGLAGGGTASTGKSLIYYRHPIGVIALDKNTKKEVWRLLTIRFPYRSHVLEVGENLALVQIGSDVPATIHTSLVGGGLTLKMRGLEPHTLKQRVAAAMLLHQYGDGYLRPEVRKLIEQHREEKNDPTAAAAAKALEKIMSSWPKTRDRQRLQDGCIAALLGASEGNPLRETPDTEATRLIVWGMLQELIYGRPIDGYGRQGYNFAYHDGWVEQSIALSEIIKAKLVAHCRKVIGDKAETEKPFAISVLLSTTVGWAKLTDAERKQLFLSSNPSGWRWAAVALAKNGQRKELMEWSAERGAEDQLDVIWILKHDKPKVWSKEELAFWLAAARRNTGGVAYVLGSTNGPVPNELRELIRAYLEREIAAPTIKDNGTVEAGYLYAAVFLLDSWKSAEDTPLLLKYMKHPVLHLRGHVRNLLENRGVKVPPDKEAAPEKK